MFLAAKLQEGAVRGQTVLLSGNVGIGDRALPKTWILEERLERGSMLICSCRELLGSIFVRLLSDFPDLGETLNG